MKTRWLFLVLLLLLLIPAAALAEVHIMVVSDPHYLAPALYAGSELFLQGSTGCTAEKIRQELLCR